MAGYDLGTAWIQVAVSGNGLSKSVEGQLNNIDYSKSENNITSRLGGAFSKVGRIATAALGAAAAIGVGAAFASIASEAISASDATDKFQSTLKFAGKSSADIDRLTKSTTDYANKTVYGLGDIQNVTSQLAANNVKGYDSLAEAAGNLNAVAGGNAETFKSVGMVLTQTAGATILTTENWNQMADAIPGASGKLQDAMLKNGAYTGNFRDAMTEGQITAEEFNQAIMDLGMTDAAKEAATSTKTLEGAWGNLQATLVQGAMGIVDKVKPAITGFLTSVGNGAQTAFEWIDTDLTPALGSLYDLLTTGTYDGNLFGLSEDSALVNFLQNVQSIGSSIWNVISTSVIPAVTSFLVTVGGWGGWSTITSFLGTLASNQAVLVAVVAAFTTWKILTAAWSFGTFLVGMAAKTAAFVRDTAAMIANKSETIALKAMYAGDFLRTLGQQALALAKTAAAWVVDTAAKVANKAASVALGIGSFIADLARQAAAVAVVTVRWLAQKAAMLVVRTATGAYTAAQWLLNAALNANPIGLVIIALVALGAGLTLAWQKSDTFRSIVTGAWEGIKSAVSAVASWFTATLLPTLSGVWEGIKSAAATVGGVIASVWNGILSAVSTVVSWFQTYVQPVLSAVWSVLSFGFTVFKDLVIIAWAVIQAGVAVVVDWFQTYVQPVLSAVASVIGTVFSTMQNTISTVWNGIKSAVSVVADWFSNTLQPKMTSVTDGIKSAFTTMKDGIQTVWDSIKSVAAKPVNFLIETVYTDGIKSMADKIADKLGLSLRLPSVSKIPGYATGGQWQTMTPGYTPGKDVYHFFSPDGGGALKLSGGEGIIRPDALRALGGKAWLDRVNASRGTGLSSVGDVGTVAFAEGGIWDRVKNTVGGAVSSAADWIEDTADAVANIISDPIGAVTTLIKEPVDALMENLPGSGLFHDMAAEMPGKWITGFGDWLKGKTASMSASDIVTAARTAIGTPYVWGGSSIPPGVDCSGLVYWAAHETGSQIARMTAAGYQRTAGAAASSNTPGSLLFWGDPAYHVAIASGNGMMVEAPRRGMNVRETAIYGSPSARSYKFDQGGWLQPGYTSVVNETGKPEAVFTSAQLDKLNAGAALPDEITLNVDGEQLTAFVEARADGRIVKAAKMGV